MTKENAEIDLDRLLLIAGGHNAFQLLWAGVQLELFTLLSREPDLPLQQIGERLGLRRYPCRVLLVGLTALGVINKDKDRYSNAALTERMLVKGAPDYAGKILGWQAHIVYPGMMHFLDSLRQGTNLGLSRFSGSGDTLYERLADHPDLEQIFQDAMSALSAQANRHLVDAYDFGHLTHLVDAGGGDGTNAIALARRFPDLKLTVFDSRSVCEIARRKVEAEGLSGRISAFTGDFLSDPFPPDADAILFSHIFSIWSMERNAQLLRKCYAALPPGGEVILFNMMGNDDDTGPLSTALGSPYFLAIATGEGMLHAWKDYEEAMRHAGFADITRVVIPRLDHGLLIGKKA